MKNTLKNSRILWCSLMLFCLLTACTSDDATTTPTEPTNEDVSTDDDTSSGNITYFLVGDTNTGGAIPIGCEQFAIPQATDTEITDTPRDIRTGLEALFSAESGDLTNFWTGTTITELTLPAGGLRLQLIGGYAPTGVCADAAAEAQLLLIVFSNEQLQQAFITLNGRNMKQVFDASGLVEAGATYTREDVPAAP
ncbi:MAG: hypothetical protein RLP44_08070 [Aggregatilineales bacterium]